MRTWLVARKSLLEIVREPQLIGLVIALPVIFVIITAFAYNPALLVRYKIAVDSTDPAGDPLIAQIEALHYADGSPVFDLTRTDQALRQVEKHDLAALVTITPDAAGRLAVTVHGDMFNLAFNRANASLKNVINSYGDTVEGRAPAITIRREALAAHGPTTYFDLYAPGMFIFAWLMLIPQTAMLIARELRGRTLNRLRLTRLRAWDLLAGSSLAQIVIALVQVIAVFVTALALGFHNQGSLAVAVVVGLAISFSAIGSGLIVACFVQDDSQAANIGGAVAMVQVFFSGAFYAMPPMTMFTLAGHPIDVFDLFPATSGFLALQRVLCYGASFGEIGFRLALTFGLAAVYFLAGVIIFHRLKMREQG